jgi:hypothetical protein
VSQGLVIVSYKEHLLHAPVFCILTIDWHIVGISQTDLHSVTFEYIPKAGHLKVSILDQVDHLLSH